jgi:general secretion pathway protein I
MNRRRLRVAGFTLVEVMLALAILGAALVVLVKSIAGNVAAAQDSFYMGVATDLARGKMYDLEEDLMQEGFQETEQELDGDFSDDGWANVSWKAKIEPVELPSFETLIGLAQAQAGDGDQAAAAGSSDGSGSDADSPADKFQSSALGGLLGLLGGGGGDEGATAGQAQSAGFLQSNYTLVQQVLKQAIRKITLTINYDTGLHKDGFDVVLYVTDAAGMQKVLGNLGVAE